MNHYDDLQRFKDKTRSQQFDFKDFSAQNQAQEQGSWAIINQLQPETAEHSLAAGGHVSLSVPQPVSDETFAHAQVAPVQPTFMAEPVAVPSILRGVDEQLTETLRLNTIAPKPEPTPAPVHIQTAEPTPEPVNFARLFAPAVSTPAPTAEKNQPLQSLLERIGTCR